MAGLTPGDYVDINISGRSDRRKEKSMATTHGKFCWYELMTTDAEAALAFYGKVVGWQGRDAGQPGIAYTLLSMGQDVVAGLMAFPKEACAAGEAKPGWVGHVAVDDVDTAAAKLKRLGGAVRHGPQDIPNVGRFAFVADPHGAPFMLFKGQPQMHPSPAATPTSVGRIGWHELMAGDLASDFAFYADMFGWTKGQAMDMGPMGTYQIFEIGGQMAGGMMTKPPQVPAPHWHYYIQVPAIDAAAARVKEGGGQVMHGPMEVPGGAWIVQCVDPQGAFFELVAGKR
jgi:predicted enzyme related to lactoylglutathione lyase